MRGRTRLWLVGAALAALAGCAPVGGSEPSDDADPASRPVTVDPAEGWREHAEIVSSDHARAAMRDRAARRHEDRRRAAWQAAFDARTAARLEQAAAWQEQLEAFERAALEREEQAQREREEREREEREREQREREQRELKDRERAAQDQRELREGSPGDGDRDPAPEGAQPEALTTSTSPEGFTVAGGGGTGGSGAPITFTVEVEAAAGVAIADAVDVVEDALFDPRSWGRDRTLTRIDDPNAAQVRVLVATGETVDRLCAQAGLRTVGRYSCWNGTFTALTLSRWQGGADGFDDLATYRRYLVNHEFGHALGHGHVGCPGAGQLAPVMMQQSMRLDGCVANGWPYP